MDAHERVGHDDEAGLFAAKQGYRGFNFGAAPHPRRDRLDRQRSGVGLERI
jgi:hypothetical protein